MDRTTAWQWLHDAIDAEDWPGARDQIAALANWRNRGGFAPSQDDVMPFDTHEGMPADVAAWAEHFNSWVMAAQQNGEGR